MDNKRTVLVVEDNPLNMKLISDLLGVEGFLVLKAEDAETALEILKTTTPSLIILDIYLPGIDGFKLLEEIKKQPHLKNIKVLAQTALAMIDDEEKIKEAGFDAYITKPLDTKKFMEIVRSLIN